MADAEIGLTIVPALSFAQKAAAIGGTALAFVLLDALWLGWASRDLYTGTIGQIMVQPPRWDAAVLFYLVYLAGTLHFVEFSRNEGDFPNTCIAQVFGLPGIALR